MKLTEALEGLTEGRFCTGVYARDARGQEVLFDSKYAVRYCVTGWLRKTGSSYEIHNQAKKVARHLGFSCSTDANDALGYWFVETLRNWEEPT